MSSHRPVLESNRVGTLKLLGTMNRSGGGHPEGIIVAYILGA